jgi:hypothetical protein
MAFCNPMTCGGFGNDILGGCSMFWIAAVILAFIIIFGRRWIPELTGINWSTIGSGVLGFVALFAVGYLTCSYKFALIGGIIGCFIGAYFGGLVLGEGGGY